MKATGEIICKQYWGDEDSFVEHILKHHPEEFWVCLCQFSARCEWKGGRIAEMSGALLEEAKKGVNPGIRMTGKHTLTLGNIHVRILGLKIVGGLYYHNVYYIMREGWYARLIAFDLAFTLGALDVCARVEEVVRALFGQKTKGRLMRLTAFIAERVL